MVAAAKRADELQHEVQRRRGWRWWLKAPFVRLGILK
jgi:hypothetical protein